MTNYKSEKMKRYELAGLITVLLFVLVHAVIRHDSIPALISALCGITYTFLAGKGLPVCYIFGLTGSAFYGFLSLNNHLWGNLLLYAGYYIPMQILGYFRWNKNLHADKQEIIKIRLPLRELTVLIIILSVLCILVWQILLKIGDFHPILDSITTVLSIGGMYLTVRRAIEQWIFWFIVNLLSMIMWISVAFSGVRVYSTIIMWAVYLSLSIYFYFCWHKELSVENLQNRQ